MVAKVITGKTIRGVLSYNENKVKEGTAICLAAEKFADELGSLTFSDKLGTFLYYHSKNPKTKTNTVHISLNFDQKDKLNPERLNAIAYTYLNKIGFGHQPFLIYQHFDAAHPHVHIVTTNIEIDGNRMDLHNIGRNQSEKARTEIENEFNLIRAKGRKQENVILTPIDISRAVYGKSETKRSIANIVNAVTHGYKFTSVHELNAILKQYNVIADRGKEGTHMRAKNGLQYSLIDKSGNAVGVPIKASSIYGKPTLNNLSVLFDKNETLKDPHKQRVKEAIDNICSNREMSFQDLTTHLALENIYTVIRQSSDRKIYGLTFIDNQTKCVFNGSDLGKQYSAQGILGRLGREGQRNESSVPRLPVKEEQFNKNDDSNSVDRTYKTQLSNAIDDLASAKIDYSTTPYELRKRKKKRGRRM